MSLDPLLFVSCFLNFEILLYTPKILRICCTSISNSLDTDAIEISGLCPICLLFVFMQPSPPMYASINPSKHSLLENIISLETNLL